tara:strand:- start:59 stop:538 length:480 start_codon:yes stop_codon:yes gene_type:complete
MIRLLIIFNLICSLLAVLLPLALYLNTGTIENSFSSYHGTTAENILTYSLLTIALSFILTENIVSGLLLIGITVFNMHEYEIIHNLLAYAFFVYATYNIIKDKRYRYIGFAMVFFAILIPIITLYWYEVIALCCLALYGFLYSLRKLKIEINKLKTKIT